MILKINEKASANSQQAVLGKFLAYGEESKERKVAAKGIAMGPTPV